MAVTVAGGYENDQLVYGGGPRELIGKYLSKAGIGTNTLDIVPSDPNIQIDFTIDYDVLFFKNSTEVTDDDRLKIAAYLQAVNYDQIIVLYGNNPESYFRTEKYVKEVVKRKTIVFVGSKKPFDVYFSDAPIFLGMAITMVQLKEPGVYHVINF